MAPIRIRPERLLSYHMLEAEAWHKGQRRKGPLTEEGFREWLEGNKSPKVRLQILGQLARKKGQFEKSIPRMEALRVVPAAELPGLWSMAGSQLMQKKPPAFVVREISQHMVETIGLNTDEARAAARHIVADAREQVPAVKAKETEPPLQQILKGKRRLGR